MRRISFTPKFYNTIPPAPPPPKKQAFWAAKPIILSNNKYPGLFLTDFEQNSNFKKCKKEYFDLLDRVIDFSHTNADKVTPPLSMEGRSDIAVKFNDLKNHINDSNGDFFGAHKEIIFGVGKEFFHELDDLLKNETIPLQKRMNAVVVMAPAMAMCSGGVLTALQEAVSGLKHSSTGIQGAAYRAKIQMMDALISEHVRQVHRGCGDGNEVHYVNAYFNQLAGEMGVPARKDHFTWIAHDDINPARLAACRKMVLTKLNPNALTKVMANSYLDQVKGAQQVDVNQAISGDDLTDVFKRSNDIKQATLNHEFGEVPDSSYLLADPDYSYHFAQQPTLLAKHFMGALKNEKIVNYDDAIKLSKDHGNGAIKMLGDLFWRDQEGECSELGAKELFEVSPDELARRLSRSRMSLDEQGGVFNEIAQHVLDSRHLEDVREVPDQWLERFADLFRQGVISGEQVDPVVQLAAQFGCADTLRTLIPHGADIHAPNPQGDTPLMQAARDGHASAVSLLLQAGVDPELRTPQGDTVLMLCGQNGHTEALRAVLQHGPTNINARNPSLETALMLAAREGHVGTLIALIDAKADLKIRNEEGDTALMIARQGGRRHTASVILDAAAQAAKTGDTLLMQCVERGHTQAIQALIQHGGNVNAQHPKSGVTALMIAARKGDVAVLRGLLQAGAQPNIQAKGVTALDLARQHGHDEVVTALINAGAEPPRVVPPRAAPPRPRQEIETSATAEAAALRLARLRRSHAVVR